MYFTSTADLKGAGTPGVKRLYVLELEDGNRLYRLSDSQQLDAGIAANLTFAIFVSESDWLGNGNNQKQLFFLNSFRMVRLPDPVPAGAGEAMVLA